MSAPAFGLTPILSGRISLPSLGFGGAALGGMFSSVDTDQATATLSAAFDAGMTYVDSAPYYGFGRSERAVGDAIRGRNYILSTKVGRLLEAGAIENAADFGWPDALRFHPVFDSSEMNALKLSSVLQEVCVRRRRPCGFSDT